MLGWFTPRVFLGRRLLAQARRGLTVLTYHRLGPAPAAARDPFLYTTARRFDEQLTALRRAGLAVIPLSEADPGGVVKPGTAVVTFDDGFRNTLELGLEILSRHKVRAIQFLIAGALGGKNDWDIAKGDVAEPLMDAAEVRDWLAAGQQIGSHSLSHPNLRKIPLAQAREEITASRKRLEDTFGRAVEHFCYPYGSYNEAIRDLVSEAGYRTACTVRFGVNRSGVSPFELNRVVPLSGAEFLGKALHRLRDRVIPR